jgi:hypothetical protein
MNSTNWTECVYCSQHIEPGDGELQKRFVDDKEKSPFHCWCFDKWNSIKAFEVRGPDD